MRHVSKCLALAMIVFALGFPRAAVSQSAEAVTIVPSRIVDRIDDSSLVQLKGNVHPRALPQFDRGAVEASYPLDRMLLILQRSPEQDAALRKFMAEQYDSRSPNYHRWLEPAEFGHLYGPSDSDMVMVTSWLSNHGFAVTNISKGRVFIEFSGNAGQVQEAFHTEIHRYMVEGQMHLANSADPSIPTALRPVVAGIFSLHNFLSKPMHRDFGTMRRDSKTKKWIPLDESEINKPLFNVPVSGGNFELVTPYDFAKIYNVGPLWTAGFDGTGQTIAIAGRSDISLTDVANFRSSFGLPAKAPTIIVNGADPGIPSAGDKVENTLDVEWSGAVAKGATIKFVTTKSTSTTDGAVVSATYIIDNKTAPIMSFSYGSCELQLGTSGNTAVNSLWQQGVAQGITIFVASGDQGSAVCDGGQTAPYGAQFGLEASGHSTTPYNVAVGGTDLNWGNHSGTTYWSSTNATNGSSALSYIPEVPWNGSCASQSVDLLLGFTAAGYDNEQACQYMITNSFDTSLVNVVGGSGGKSHCTAPTGTTPASCAGGYAKPSWQVGTGVPADSKRDVPDVSLFASSGALNTAYAICDSQTTPCTYSNANDALAQAVGGTSVASPAFAGIMALVNQKMGAAQGNANVAFYALAAKDNRSSCNSTTVAAGNACNFYDITTDNNAAPCIPGDPDCTVHHSGDQVGILNGYSSTTGFDLATGLGSVNVNNLVNNWHLVVATAPAVSLTPTTITFPTTAAGATSASTTVTLKNTGTGSLSITSIALAGTSPSDFTIPSKTCTTTLAAGSSCTFTVAFKPAAASTTYHATVAVTDNATGSPQSVALTGTSSTSGGPTPLTLTPTSIAFATADVGTTSTAQSVTIKNGGTITVTIHSITLTGTNVTSFSQLNTCGTTLAAGTSCTSVVSFNPKSAGSLTASLSISSTASASAQTVSLSGTATAQPTLVLNPTSVSFATTTHGTTSKTSVVSVVNSGTTTASIYDIVLSGANPTDFSMLTTCGNQLGRGGVCSIYIAFKPAAAAAYTGSVIVYSNGVGNPQTITLKGTGN